MKEMTLRKWHRYAGISLMPLLVVQILSGFLLSIVDLFGFVERTPEANPEGLAFLVIRKLPKFLTSYDDLMMALHFSRGSSFASILRALVAIALVWIMISGISIFLNMRARTKNMMRQDDTKGSTYSKIQ